MGKHVDFGLTDDGPDDAGCVPSVGAHHYT